MAPLDEAGRCLGVTHEWVFVERCREARGGAADGARVAKVAVALTCRYLLRCRREPVGLRKFGKGYKTAARAMEDWTGQKGDRRLKPRISASLGVADLEESMVFYREVLVCHGGNRRARDSNTRCRFFDSRG